MDPSIVQRDSGFYIVDFEQVEFDLQPTANIFGPFKTEVAAKGFHGKYLASGYASESGMLFTKEDDEE